MKLDKHKIFHPEVQVAHTNTLPSFGLRRNFPSHVLCLFAGGSARAHLGGGQRSNLRFDFGALRLNFLKFKFSFLNLHIFIM